MSVPILAFVFITEVAIAQHRPLNIAHRGSSGMYPEHTMEGYRHAIAQGADIIECDVSLTRDRHLVCLHESWLNHTTDVSQHPEFRHRLRTYDIPGVGNVTNWFSVDFTLAELRTLGKVQQHQYRDQTMNGQFHIPTLGQYLNLALEAQVGIYPELKNPKWINSLEHLNLVDQSFETLLLDELRAVGMTERTDACLIQSFDLETIVNVANQTSLRCIYLTESTLDDEALRALAASSIYGVGIWKDQILPSYRKATGYKNRLGRPTDFVTRAHASGLQVHLYTLRNEDRYLAHNYGQDPHAEILTFLELNVDGFFTDFPLTLASVLDRRF